MASSSSSLLQGKVAIITGSSSGIGEEMAYEFIKQGASVTLHGRNVDRLEMVEKICLELSGSREKVLTVAGEIREDDIRLKLIEETVKKFGKLDILISNAGHYESADLSADFDLSRLDSMLNVYVRAPFHLTKLAIPHLVQTKGNIIYISSFAATRVIGSGIENGMAKAALNQLTRYSSFELGPKNVRVNTISLGVIETPIFAKQGFKLEDLPKVMDMFRRSHPLKRCGTVQEVAKVASFLASDSASFVTGIVMPVDGGMEISPPKGFQSES